MSIKIDKVYYSTLLGTLGEYDREQFSLNLQGTLGDYYSGRNVLYFKKSIVFERPNTLIYGLYNNNDSEEYHPIGAAGLDLLDFDTGGNPQRAYVQVLYYTNRCTVQIVVFTNAGPYPDQEITPQTYNLDVRLLEAPLSV